MELHYPVILDGATGTMLQAMGYDGSGCYEDWVLAHPEKIIELQRGYIEAGSDIVYAPTFGANRVKLAENGIIGRTREYNLRLAAVSKEAAGGRALVAGDIAPTGKFLRPFGDMEFEELVDIYTEQISALEEAGVDLYVIETMMTVSDARAALIAAKSLTKKPVIVTFSINESGKSISGSEAEAIAAIMDGLGADVFGMNCSVGPDGMAAQMKRLREYTDMPLAAKANAGMPEIINGRTVYNCPPDEYVGSVKDLVNYGVCFFGGCCGTTPEHIAKLSETLKNAEPESADFPHRYEGKLPCATEKKLFLLEPDAAHGGVISCGEGLEDRFEEANESDEPMLALRIEHESDIEDLAEYGCIAEKPLCLVCDDAALLEKALRVYQGRPLYEGGIPKEQLMPLVKKYGVII